MLTSAIELIKEFEGFRAKPYKLPGEPYLTIGFGRHEASIKSYERTTKKRELAWLKKRIASDARKLDELDLLINHNQRQSLLSFIYNVGFGAFLNSTMLKFIRARNYQAASHEFTRWVKGSHGKSMPGLVRRRKAERALFDLPIDKVTIPQTKSNQKSNQEMEFKKAAKYTTGDIAHQNKAWDFLQSKTSDEVIDQFTMIYRNVTVSRAPAQREAPKQAPTRSDDVIVQTILRRIKELDIKLSKPTQEGYIAYVIGLEGCGVDFVTNSDLPDWYNDAFLVLMVHSDGRVTRSRLVKGTTEPGTYYVKNRLNPAGAAFVAIDEMHKDIWMRGRHKRQANCLIQIGAPIKVIRDSNNSHGRSQSDPIQTGFFGINYHYGGSGNSIGRHSAGCAVVQSKDEHQYTMDFINKALNKKVSYILLDREAMD